MEKTYLFFLAGETERNFVFAITNWSTLDNSHHGNKDDYKQMSAVDRGKIKKVKWWTGFKMTS